LTKCGIVFKVEKVDFLRPTGSVGKLAMLWADEIQLPDEYLRYRILLGHDSRASTGNRPRHLYPNRENPQAGKATVWIPAMISYCVGELFVMEQWLPWHVKPERSLELAYSLLEEASESALHVRISTDK